MIKPIMKLLDLLLVKSIIELGVKWIRELVEPKVELIVGFEMTLMKEPIVEPPGLSLIEPIVEL